MQANNPNMGLEKYYLVTTKTTKWIRMEDTLMDCSFQILPLSLAFSTAKQTFQWKIMIALTHALSGLGAELNQVCMFLIEQGA